MLHTLLNTLFVQTQGAYLHLDHETLRVEVEKELKLQIPLHHLSGIVVFGNVLLSPFLIQECADSGRDIVWFTEWGQFKARATGPTSGNVLLRVAQYKASEDPEKARIIARAFVEGKIHGSRYVLDRTFRDYADDALKEAGHECLSYTRALQNASSIDEVRGIEGSAAAAYFDAFPALIRADGFAFDGRERRPPCDPVNALLSFTYTLLVRDCQSALEGVGLDPQVGFLHALRPGRPALALDLMEEFRAPFADRLVLSLINRQQLSPRDFEKRPGGAVLMKDSARKSFLAAYQSRKQETVKHPLFKEPVPVGLLPHIQARLLARHIRGDLNRYIPYRWR
jgi:CRISPR-associated protein Cas1